MTKISDVLHLAADKYLAATREEYVNCLYKASYSCVAIEDAITELCGEMHYPKGSNMHFRILDGLEAMGLDTSSGNAFDQWGYTMSNLQQARYGWLKLAALMAEEQGV